MKQVLLGLILSLVSVTGFAYSSEFIVNKSDYYKGNDRYTAGHHHQRRATKRVSIDLAGAHIRGQNVVYLRKALRQQRPDLALRDHRIRKVILVGKTRHGGGTSTLRIGDWWGDAVEIDGTPRTFSSNHPRTFDRVIMNNKKRNAQGPWQLYLQGNLKLKRVIIVLEELVCDTQQSFRRHDVPEWIGRQS